MNSLRHAAGLVLLPFAMALLAGGCRAAGGAEGDNPAEQRSVIQGEQQKTLQELYAAHPQTKEKVANAAGHAYFSNVNVNLLVMSTENGYGVVHDNKANKDTFMKMAGAGVGIGAGVKDYRAVFIFTDPALLKKFMESGMNFGGQADAAAKTGEDGAAAGGAGSAVPGLEVYQFTQKGVALQATLQGTKYWRDDKLNQ